MQYVGQTSRPLKTRFREHKYNSNNKKSKVETYLYSHFRRTGHTFNNTNIQIVENFSFDPKTNNSNKTKLDVLLNCSGLKITDTFSTWFK